MHKRAETQPSSTPPGTEDRNRRPSPIPTQATRDGVDDAIWHQLARALGARQFPVVLTGDVGTGKTCAAAVVFRWWSRAWSGGDYEPDFYRAPELVRMLVNAQMGRPGFIDRGNGQSVEATEEKIRDICRRCSLLVLDDVGTVSNNAMQLDALLSILEWTEGRALLVTTNYDINKTAEIYGPRIASRLFSGATVKFSGYDRRGNR